MTKIDLLKLYGIRAVKIIISLLIPLLLLIGLNYRQLYAAWLIKSETQRLLQLAADAPAEFQNPASSEDDFDGQLSPEFWKFTNINGAGEISNGTAWHSAAISFNQSLTLQHFSDPDFWEEAERFHLPAADRYNNITLIGGRGFRPSVSQDVVLQFTMRVSQGFYGTAGVIFQPVGTIGSDGLFAEPFDMFGFSITGEESSVLGASGPLCYLALNQVPAQVQPLEVDATRLHDYEVRLHWVSQTEWLGSVKVDETVQCQIAMPPFGPTEVHVWSDNALVLEGPRRWWEIGPAMDLKYQDGGDKQFSLEVIRILAEAR